MPNQFVKAYTIKEVSKMINIPPGTLRQWEKDLDGLLVIPRSKQGARFYTNEEIKLLETIKQMRNKNLSKEMIKELLHQHMVSESTSESIETSLAPISEEEISSREEIPDISMVYAAMETFRNQLIDDVRAEIRTSIRKEVLEEVKKEISKGSVHIVKSLSDSIYKSNEKTKLEIHELSNHIHNASEHASETLEALSKRVAKASKGTSEQLRSLVHRVTESSEAASEEFKTMIHYISSSAEVTHTEISALIETLNTDREIYLETITREREQYWEDVNHREMMFQDLIVSFRKAAAAEEKVEKPWWKFWS
ncbi:MerR family transcriptional regulator [Bacillus sp. DTU_2020_1000418_1_SI_GHA_SEK_038]|uniref:MerR family transcriptional regulator n=1 Tax=Bacillus sp. DTU_2020_1000418_1_SI_GHA_SEK_038 TaxID=3077585 RepID=UPI0028E8AB95|nr:MerR family transcriptional regulator [Bacillus sp. DTU_2020_1000418_1_SI_GHA_SEK_038]WNS73574.1 MerR family transcriptional regulator [Bacillus sp. DTU_2020_1000418_1_SI_GHA_SEK_038]